MIATLTSSETQGAKCKHFVVNKNSCAAINIHLFINLLFITLSSFMEDNRHVFLRANS
jgi:hypothetical protein